MRTRKQVNELTADDFERHPCWQYAMDEEGGEGQNECTVRPIRAEEAIETGFQFFVQTAFFFPNGRVRIGAVTVNAGEDLASHQPVMFTAKDHLHFYCGALEPSEKELKRFRGVLKKICSEPYPIRYVSAMHGPSGEPLASGVLKGLYWLVDWRKGKVNVVA